MGVARASTALLDGTAFVCSIAEVVLNWTLGFEFVFEHVLWAVYANVDVGLHPRFTMFAHSFSGREQNDSE